MGELDTKQLQAIQAGQYSLVSLTFQNMEPPTDFIIFEPDAAKAQRVARFWIAESLAGKVKELAILPAADASQARRLLEAEQVIPISYLTLPCILCAGRPMQNQLGYVPGERLDQYPCLACAGLGAVAVRIPPEACDLCKPRGLGPSENKLCDACGGRGWRDSRVGIQRISDKEIEAEVLGVNQRFTDAALRQDAPHCSASSPMTILAPDLEGPSTRQGSSRPGYYLQTDSPLS